MNYLHLILNVLSAIIRIVRAGGVRALVAENITLRHQLVVVRRHRKRAPKLTVFDRLTFGFLTAFIQPRHLSKIAIILKPATLLKFHQSLVKQKYRFLYSAKIHKKPGLKGPRQELINVIVAMKRHNPRFGYRRIAMQITLAFGIEMDKDTVRRVLSRHYKNTPKPKGQGPSWLTFLGHLKDSLWPLDLFRCESIHLKTYWIMVVMGQCTHRVIGLPVHAGVLGGIAVCCLFNKIIFRQSLPKYLSSDNDPLFTSYRCQANLRILDIKEIKSVPHVPISYPFVERLIRTIRRECLDHILFWNAIDCQNKLNAFLRYYTSRGHSALAATTPLQEMNDLPSSVVPLNDYRWQSHYRGLFELPIAA